MVQNELQIQSQTQFGYANLDERNLHRMRIKHRMIYCGNFMD